MNYGFWFGAPVIFDFFNGQNETLPKPICVLKRAKSSTRWVKIQGPWRCDQNAIGLDTFGSEGKEKSAYLFKKIVKNKITYPKLMRTYPKFLRTNEKLPPKVWDRGA